MNPLKIIHILPNAHIGGIQKYVYELVEEQKKNSQLIPSILFYNSIGDMKGKFEALEIQLFYFDLQAFDFSITRNRELTKTISEHDIVHWHVFIPSRLLFNISTSIKQIFTHHSVIGLGRVAKKTDVLKWKLFKYFINKKMDGVIFNSEFTRNFWINRGILGKKTKLIYNGVNLNEKTELPVDDGTENQIAGMFVIGTTSNFIELKRVEWLIRSFGKFQQGKSDVRLLLVGDGYMKKTYEDIINILGISKITIMPGHRLNISSYQKKMDICVFPSVTETFGLVAVECLHLGKPVIVCKDGGGIVEVVGKNSADVVAGVDELTDRLNYYYANRDQLKCEEAVFRQRASFFTISRNEGEVMQFYQQIYNGK